MSLEERKDLLEKLKAKSKISQAPLYSDDNDTGAYLDFEEQYFYMPWYYRLWYSILGFFKNKAPLKLYEDRQAILLGKKIEKQFPGIYDYQKGMLLPLFYAHLQNLKTASRFFFKALDAGFSKDNGAFFAFLSSLEMPDTHTQLLAAANPALMDEKKTGAPEAEIRSMAFRAMDDALKVITDEQKEAMYYNARSLFCLKELSSYLFDRLLVSFNYDPALGGYTCNIRSISDMLTSLNNVLFSLKTIPPMPLLESLFIFLLQEKTEDKDFEINNEIQILLIRAEESLTVIRDFNTNVPLMRLLKCVGRSSRPREIPGGEDWFLIYREYWKRQIEDNFIKYAKDRRTQDLLESSRNLLKGLDLKALDNVASDINPDGFPLNGALGLSFLKGFYSTVYIPNINKNLKAILDNGDSNRKENRVEFIDTYNALIEL